MGTGKTYSTKYLLDSNNSSGVAGQVLSTTSTGIDWVDANTVPGTGLWLANGNNIYNSNSGNVGIGTSSPYGRLNVIPSSNPTTPTAANQISIGESSANSQYNLRLGYFLEGGAYKGSIQAISGNTPNILILNGDGGNVGIGTTSPVQKLQVNGSVYSNGGEFFVNTNSGITAVGNLIFKGHNGTSYFEGMRLASTGNVGIGTTTPQSKLQVAAPGAGEFAGANSSAAGGSHLMLRDEGSTSRTLMSGPSIVFQTPASSDGTNIWATSRLLGSPAAAGSARGTFSIQVRDQYDPFNDGTSWNWRTCLTAINTGNVGIGTNSPSSQFNVHKNALTPAVIELSNVVASGDNDVVVAQIKANTVNEELTRIETRNSPGSHDNGNLLFYNRNGSTNTFAESMRIAGDGNVGIGQDTPLNSLDVYRATGDASIRIQAETATDSTILKFRNSNADADITVDYTTSNKARMVFNTDNSGGYVPVLSLEANRDTLMYGNVGIGTTGPQAKLHVYDTAIPSSGDIITNKIYSVGDVTANSNTRTGLDVETTRTGWYNSDSTSGNFKISINNRIGASTLIGVKSLATIDVNNIYSGVSAQGSLIALYGRVTTTFTTGSSPVATAYGLRIDAPEVATNSEIVTYYGAYINGGSVSGTLTNKYALVTEAEAGNVGIGTASPETNLQIGEGTGTQRILLYGANSLSTSSEIILADSSSGPAVYRYGAGIRFDSTNNILSLRSFFSGNNTQDVSLIDLYRNTAVENTPIRINYDTSFSGNVGIGVTSPAQKLHVGDGGIRVEKNATGLGGFISIGNGTEAAGNYSAYFFGNTSNDTGYFKGGIAYETLSTTHGRGDMHFLQRSDTGSLSATISDSVMTILNSGNVGIGTTSPNSKLEVRDGTISGEIAKFSAIGATVVIESSTAGNAKLFLKPSTTGLKRAEFRVTNANDYGFLWTADTSANGTAYMELEASSTGGGDLTVKGDVIAYGSPSDKKYKENIKPIESALDKAMKLQGVTFDWKDSESILEIKEDIGFIAQDVQEVLPELVRENKKGNLSLRYQGITPILLEAIKELKAEIEELKLNNCNCNK